MSGLIYDTGALVAADSGDRRIWALHKRALERGMMPVVPAGVWVEAWRDGRNANLTRFLKGTEIEPLTQACAKQAGLLLAGSDRSNAIDATVAETATRYRWPVVTGDRGDLKRLAEAAGQPLNIIDI